MGVCMEAEKGATTSDAPGTSPDPNCGVHTSLTKLVPEQIPNATLVA